MKKVYFTLVACIVLLSLTTNCYAEANVNGIGKPERVDIENISRAELEKNAYEIGYPESTLEGLSDEDLKELFLERQAGNKVVVDTTVLTVNSFEEIQDFIEYGPEKMIKEGYDSKTINEAQQAIDDLFDMSDKQLKKEGMTEPQIKVLKEIESGIVSNAKDKSKVLDVEASGDLSQSECSVVVSTTSCPTEKRKVQYKIKTTYNWKKVPFFTFTDRIVYAWGGGLNLDDNSLKASIKFYKLNGNHGFLSYYKTYNLTKAEMLEEIQTACTFKIRMSKYEAKVAKTGTVNATIYQTKKEGKESKLHVKYGHAKIAIGGVSISNAPSISFGIGYDSTNPPVKKVIKY